jgi:hypothetical protein
MSVTMGSYSRADRREHRRAKRLRNKRSRAVAKGTQQPNPHRFMGIKASRRNRRGGDRVRRYQYAGRGRWERVE